MAEWVRVCGADGIEQEGVIRFDHAGRTYAVYRSPEDDYFCTDGLCTHEAIHLADGLVMDYEIECPKHGGIFDYRTGSAMRLPACRDLNTYPARLADGAVEILVG
ncbi:MocE family 2Fe-2S type ferredoxin [Gellertiella hungarica]|uniref:3-phenylpropionate/trans-cinnamate dioxygenase ferredoxin subunit n=1 Tax=Gellertiella hungarica TaxID=1572859 RepID=A0A7W6NLP2_9HYPH|nr:MocE family 2Fe-2S type ferredoxin [Gellertiella hungarica]MBB4065635.1 3-phenylpropionate/trans-cinnamate dioxygenase ferredoxin subunit [Gellertiella hungarica]